MRYRMLSSWWGLETGEGRILGIGTTGLEVRCGDWMGQDMHPPGHAVATTIK